MGVGRLPRPNLTPLLGLDAGLADDLAPLRILRADEGGELGRRRGRRDLGPDGGHALDDVVLLPALHQDLVHALYLLWSETCRTAKAEPRRSADRRIAGFRGRR